jgi:hypothetical protein
MSLTLSDLRALFARSGNRCAYPGCSSVLVDSENLFVGQICHIEAASPGGPRFNEKQADEQRHGASNLMLLCYPHHRRIDSDPTQFSVEMLLNMKGTHETQFFEHPFPVDPELLDAVLLETQEYWRRLKLIQELAAQVHEYPMQIDTSASHAEVVDELATVMAELKSLTSAIAARDGDQSSGPTVWEASNIFMPNLLKLAALYLNQLDVLHLAAHLRLNPKDDASAARLEKAKAQLVRLSEESGYVD